MVGGGGTARGGLVRPQPLVPRAGGEGAAARPDPPLPQTPPSSFLHPSPAGGEWVGLVLCYWGTSAHQGFQPLSKLPQVNNNKDGGDSCMRRVINTS